MNRPPLKIVLLPGMDCFSADSKLIDELPRLMILNGVMATQTASR